MNFQTILFRSDKFTLKLNHIVIVGVLVLAFSTSMLIRSQSAQYGNELNEFDPFFNFRATEYIVENGFSEYFEWHDDKSWYPYGRDVSATSQVMLHTTAAITYQLFGGNSSLYDFTILFPAVIGSLTVVVIFGLVRLFGGTTAGLIASLLFAISLPVITRGLLGWFKSEPLGLFYALLGLYLFLSAINSKNYKIIISKIILGAIMLSFGLSSWGGNQFFIIPIGLFILVLPFFREDRKFLLWAVPLFVSIFILISSMFERPGLSFAYGLGGISLIIPTIFFLLSIYVQKISKKENKIRNTLFLLFGIIIIGSFLVIVSAESDILPMPSFRYLNAIYPFLTTEDPLVDSVAEHATTTTELSFIFNSIFMIFGGIGIWIILTKNVVKNEIFIKNDMKAFVLIFGMIGIYISSAFVRLELFASISLIIFSSIGLSYLGKEIFKINNPGKKNSLLKISFVIGILVLFITPLTYPGLNWVSGADAPPVILTGGTNYPPTNDWIDSLEWMKHNTPEDAIIVSWWDYGYWIQTMGDRTTFIDNATLIDWRIKQIANIFLSTPDTAWNELNKIDADYVVIFVSGEKLTATYDNQRIYALNGGGDESKVFWFAAIAELPLAKYFENDVWTENMYFWNETLLGKMIPFTTVTYYNDATKKEATSYLPGFDALSIKKITYGYDSEGPLKLVYLSPSFSDESLPFVNAVVIYEINKNYFPNDTP